MKTKTALIILIVIALGAGALTLLRATSIDDESLVPAWQLLDEGRYRAMGVTDPFASWAPDSRSVMFSLGSLRLPKEAIYMWRVGEKQMEEIVDGASPNHLDDSTMLYLKKQPTKAIVRRDLTTGEENEFAPAIKSGDLWDEVAAFTYVPDRDSIILRFTDHLQYYSPGTQEFDASGKPLGAVQDEASEGVVDASSEPGGTRRALIVEQREGRIVELHIAEGDAPRGQRVDTGKLGCVAWSPNGEVIAYGRSSEVVALSPDGKKRVVVARFDDSVGDPESPPVIRLSWSPNSHYLMAYVYVGDQRGDYPLYYVMDMSKFKF